MNVAILVVSDRASNGTYEDRTGPALRDAVMSFGHDVVALECHPDELDELQRTLVDWCDRDIDGHAVDIVLTAGGTGLGPRDITPQATRAVVDLEIPGLGELMRSESMKTVPTAALSRATAGVRRSSVVVNLPGSVAGAVECFGFVVSVLSHAVSQLRGGDHS